MRPSPRPDSLPHVRRQPVLPGPSQGRRRMAKNRLPEHGQVRSRRRPRPLAARLGRPPPQWNSANPKPSPTATPPGACDSIGALQFVNRAIHHPRGLALIRSRRSVPVNGRADNIRYSPLTQINRENVGRLQVAWSYDAHDAFKDSEMPEQSHHCRRDALCTTPKLRVIALNAATGQEIWSFDPSGGNAPQRRYRHRGVTVYQDRVFFTWRNFLYASTANPANPSPASAPKAASTFARPRPSRRSNERQRQQPRRQFSRTCSSWAAPSPKLFPAARIIPRL